MFYVIFIAQIIMCTKFQPIWSNRTHSDLRCHFCGTSRTSICKVYKPNVLCRFFCSIMYMYRISAHLVQLNLFWLKTLLCGTSSTSSNLVHKLNVLCCFYCPSMCAKFQPIWSNRTHSHIYIQTVTVFENSNFHEKMTKWYLIYFCD
jgi:hypothetical protein